MAPLLLLAITTRQSYIADFARSRAATWRTVG